MIGGKHNTGSEFVGIDVIKMHSRTLNLCVASRAPYQFKALPPRDVGSIGRCDYSKRRTRCDFSIATMNSSPFASTRKDSWIRANG